MKKLSLSIFIATTVSISGWSQTNTFPASGNVGIGTISPSAKLDIFGASTNATNVILSANYADKYRWRLKTIDRGNSIDMDFPSSDAGDREEPVLKLSRSNY